MPTPQAPSVESRLRLPHPSARGRSPSAAACRRRGGEDGQAGKAPVSGWAVPTLIGAQPGAIMRPGTRMDHAKTCISARDIPLARAQRIAAIRMTAAVVSHRQGRLSVRAVQRGGPAAEGASPPSTVPADSPRDIWSKKKRGEGASATGRLRRGARRRGARGRGTGRADRCAQHQVRAGRQGVAVAGTGPWRTRASVTVATSRTTRPATTHQRRSARPSRRHTALRAARDVGHGDAAGGTRTLQSRALAEAGRRACPRVHCHPRDRRPPRLPGPDRQRMIRCGPGPGAASGGAPASRPPPEDATCTGGRSPAFSPAGPGGALR